VTIRIIYDDLGTEKGYTTLTNSKDVLMRRLKRLGVSIESIKVLEIDGKRYSPEKLRG